MSFKLDDSYVEVAERIRIFRDKHPDGALQSEVTIAADGTWVLCKAFAYRAPDDQIPGIGHSRLTIPGSTPYTKGSEVENAETSAWGRAIIAALAADSKRVASADEVLSKSSEGEPQADKPGGPLTEPDRVSQAGQSEPASPSGTFVAPPPNPPPADDGQPGNVLITFGKHKDTAVKDVPQGYLEWLVGNYEPKTAEQRRIVEAARLRLGGPAQPEIDDIPFDRTMA